MFRANVRVQVVDPLMMFEVTLISDSLTRKSDLESGGQIIDVGALIRMIRAWWAGTGSKLETVCVIARALHHRIDEVIQGTPGINYVECTRVRVSSDNMDVEYVPDPDMET